MVDNKQLDSTRRRGFIKKTSGLAGAVAIAGCLGDIGGTSEDFPDSDIEMIVPWEAGGGTDRTARSLADVGEQYNDTAMYVSNVTGGGGVIGFEEIRNSSSDGHTLGVFASTLFVLHHYGQTDITYEDFTPIMQYNADPAAITVHEDAPYDSIEGFVDHASDNTLQVGSAGPGDIWHLAAEGFAQEAGIDFDHISYDGSAPAVQAVVSGEIDVTTTSIPEAAPQVEDGPLKFIASMGEEPHYQYPDVPTLTDEGYDWNLSAWRAIVGPSDVDEERVEELNSVFSSTFEDDEFQTFMENNGFNLEYRDHEELEEFMEQQHESIGAVVEEADADSE